MVIGHIERGTKLSVFAELDNKPVSDEYEAVFNYLEDDSRFVVQCLWLNENFDGLDRNAQLNLSYRVGPYIHTFTGRASAKQRAGMVLIEQLSDIETYNRRQYDRDEIRVGIRVFHLPADIAAGPAYAIPEGKPVISELTFDVSAGGLCIISNNSIDTAHDPWYLTEFAFSEKDYFLLPAELVRRSRYHRTAIGRYDYGFRFSFDAFPEEKDRLTKAILSKKLSQRRL